MKPIKIISICILILGLLAIELSRLSTGRKTQKKQKLESIQYEYPEMASGIVFGLKKNKIAYSKSGDEGHIGVFGASGQGKTSSICVPTLRHWDGSSFTMDISGDISTNLPHIKKNIS